MTMRITRLHVQGIRRHRDLDIAPAPGLTVIRGPNEAGKSTVQTALEMALFRKATSTSREMLDARTWGAPDDPQVDLTFEHDGKPGRLVKRFAGPRGTVELTLDGQVLADPTEVDTTIAEITGLPSEKFLRSTASVRHYELDGLDKDEGALRDRLQQSISGADHGTQTARRMLQDVVRRYRSEGARNPGLVRQSRMELERLRLELAEGEGALARLEADRTALAAAHDRRSQLDAQASRDQEALDAGERAVRLDTSASDAEQRYNRLRKAVELQGRITQAERDHPTSRPLGELREGVRRLKDIQFQIQEIESNVELQGDLSSPDVLVPSVPRWRPFAALAVVLLVAGFAVLGISLATTVLPMVVGVVLGVLLLVPGVASLVGALRRRGRARDVQQQVDVQAAEIQRRLRGRSQETDQLRAATRERDGLLTSLGVPDVYAADVLLERESAHGAVVDALRAELRGVLAGVQVSGDLAAERDHAAAEMERSRHALAGLGGVAQDPTAARVRAQQTLRQTQQAREAAIQEEGQAQGRVDQNTIDAERVAALAETVAVAEERLAAQERRLRVYELAFSAIDGAEQMTMKRAARYLEEHMCDDLARITDGRYRRVEVNEADLSFRVWSAELQDWVPAQQLSRGTLDQVYLAARLGLVRQVTQERRPPLIFDDPFVTFDDDRARRAAELLRDLAHDHQVLYLTTSSRYDAIADSVVVLPAPTERDDLSVSAPATASTPATASAPATASTSAPASAPATASTSAPAPDLAPPPDGPPGTGDAGPDESPSADPVMPWAASPSVLDDAAGVAGGAPA